MIFFVRLLFCNCERRCLVLMLIVFGFMFAVVFGCCDCVYCVCGCVSATLKIGTTALAAVMAVCLLVRPLCFVPCFNEVGPTEGRVTRHEKCQWLVTRQAIYV